MQNKAHFFIESDLYCFDPGNKFIDDGYYALPKVATNNFSWKFIYLYYCFMHSLLIEAFTYSVATKNNNIREINYSQTGDVQK